MLVSFELFPNVKKVIIDPDDDFTVEQILGKDKNVHFDKIR